MNTKKKTAVAAAIGAFVVLALVIAYPAVAASVDSPQNIRNQQLPSRPTVPPTQRVQLTVGQTITLTSVAGRYHVTGDPGVNGTASGTVTLQVTGVLSGGYTMSIAGGSLSINGTTYAITGGAAELGPAGRIIAGQGQAEGGQFLLLGRNLGHLGNAAYGILRVDLKSGSSEFGAGLLVTIAA